MHRSHHEAGQLFGLTSDGRMFYEPRLGDVPPPCPDYVAPDLYPWPEGERYCAGASV